MQPFTIYGRPGCGFCVAAAKLLQSRSLPYEYIDMQEKGMSPAELAEALGRSVRTVPQILHGDHYIGGYSELVPYLKEQQA